MNGEHKGDGRSIRPLLTEATFRELLGGMCQRSFRQLRTRGIVPAPLELGPRVVRWTHDDYLETLAKLPRRQARPEPAVLQQARRDYIDRMKQQGTGVPAA